MDDYTKCTKFWTCAGPVEVKSLKEVLEEIHISKVDELTSPTKSSQEELKKFIKYDDLNILNLKNYILNKIENSTAEDTSFQGYGGDESPVIISDTFNPEIVEEAAIRCINNFGSPTRLVRFNPNTWVMLDISENVIQHKVAVGSEGQAYQKLLFLNPKKSAIIKIEPEYKIESVSLEKDVLHVDISFKPKNQGIDFILTDIDISRIMDECECGKEKHNFISHSTWCPKFNK